MENNFVLQMKDIYKYFPGVKALDGVSFNVKKGEIHALMGENGAGKSTLIKVLTGLYKKDKGTVLFEDTEVEFASPQDSQKVGISTIYQEINLIPYLSVSENIFLGRELMTKGRIDWKRTDAEAEKILTDMGISLDVSKPLDSYGTAIWQMVSIARAISVNAKLVIMDEPTSSLDEKEVKILFNQMRKLKENGIAMVFISHRLDEIFEICDSITILKDGTLVGEYEAKSLSKLDLVSKMIGKDASSVLKRNAINFDSENASVLVKTADIKNKIKLRGMNIEIRKGEVLGLAGLLGSGRTEFAKVLFGDDINYGGNIWINDNPVKFKLPKDAIKYGFAYCSEDRKIEGIYPNMSIRENLTMAILGKISKGGVIDKKKQDELVDKYISDLRIKTPSANQLIKFLSGGNQQKVLLARWLCMEPELIILDEPTRGIDVGAKSEIEQIIKEISEKGISVLLISSELEEIVRNCHRVVVMRDGRDIGELSNEDISEENILKLIANYKAGEAE